jgi:hypothetical protein
VEVHRIAFADLVGLHRLDHVEIGPSPIEDTRTMFKLITDAGRFLFPTGELRDGLASIEPEGYWQPEVTVAPALGILVMMRVVPNAENQVRRMYCVDETTGLVVLEFGYIDRTYDDPNMRTNRAGVFRWENGEGWESPYLVEPDEVGGVEIEKQFKLHPKRVGAGRPKGKF